MGVRRERCPHCGVRERRGCFQTPTRAICCNPQHHQDGKPYLRGKIQPAWSYPLAGIESEREASYHAPEPPAAKLASPEDRHAAFEAILGACRETHFPALRDKRKATSSDLRQLGCLDLPTGAGWERLDDALNALGIDLTGVPGVFRSRGRWCVTRVREHNKATWEPRRSEFDLLSALHYRDSQASAKNAPAEAGGEKKGRGWLTSRGKPCGSSPGDPIGWHRPEILKEPSQAALGEGFWKAEKAARHYGMAALALPGAYAPKGLKAALQCLKDEGVKTLNLFPDQDYVAKPSVAAGWKNIARFCRKAGFKVIVHDWQAHYQRDPKLKGIDDLLNAGLEPIAEEKTNAPSGPKFKVRIEPPTAPRVLPTIENIQAELEAFLRRFVADAKVGRKVVYVARVAPGAGKSTLAQSLLKSSGLTGAYFVSSLDQRDPDCPVYFGQEKAGCPNFDKAAYERGVPHDALCQDENCPYRRQAPHPRFGQLTFAAVQVAQSRRDFLTGDYVIFDDIPPHGEALLRRKACTPADLENWREFLSTDGGRDYQAVRPIVEALLGCDRDALAYSDVETGPKLLTALRERLGAPLRAALEAARRCFKSPLCEPIAANPRPAMAPRRFLSSLIKALLAEAANEGPAWNRRVFCGRTGWRWFTPAELSGAKAVLWLDANADVEAVKHLFPAHPAHEIEFLDHPYVQIPNHVEIVHDISERAGKVAQAKGPSQQRYLARIRAFIAQGRADGLSPEQIGVIATKGLIDELRAAGDAEAVLGHLYNLRSKNEMREVEELLVIGTPTPRADDQHERCQAFWGPAKPVVSKAKEGRERRLPGKREDVILESFGWSDERLQRLHDYEGPAELHQAVERARLSRVGGGSDEQLSLLEEAPATRRGLRVTYLGHHPLPYPATRFEGVRAEAASGLNETAKLLCAALSSGLVKPNAGRGAILKAMKDNYPDQITDYKVARALAAHEASISAAREEGRKLAERGDAATRAGKSLAANRPLRPPVASSAKSRR